ncbi:LacI family DNA-binding transcriptional regulator [Salinibacterium sp.]|uniref:LacI family DNA-binding transcriptional regulator n=1 Tax=Salinibacterium sp. TaxID=1915057 RepID=UPI00286B091D|nr:LacI family DNA-binding transcriptional regulator [Salinibacterium sp.]
MPKVVIKDVAAEARVSPTTVSNYLNVPSKLSPEVSERIRNAIDKLGYVRNDAARQLRAGKSKVIGYVVFEVGNTYFSDVADAIERRAAEAGLFVVLGNNSGDVAREISYLELFEAQGVRGIIVAPVGKVDGLLDTMRKRGTPSVITGRVADHDSQPSVSVEDAEGGYLAATHLLSTGKRHLAFLGGPFELRQVSDRFLGASRAVEEHDGATLEIIPTSDRTISIGQAAALQYLQGEEGRRPDAIFAANDLLGMGFVDVLKRQSDLRVPEDVAVIGFDDMDVSRAGPIPLSTIRTPHQDFGRIAVELLLAELGEIAPLETNHVVFRPELVIRDSSVRPA